MLQVRSAERASAAASWYWRGDGMYVDALSPTFAMSAEASASLELSYRTYLETGDCLGTYKVGPIVYTSDFTLMLQASCYRLLVFLSYSRMKWLRSHASGEIDCCNFILRG